VERRRNIYILFEKYPFSFLFEGRKRGDLSLKLKGTEREDRYLYRGTFSTFSFPKKRR